LALRTSSWWTKNSLRLGSRRTHPYGRPLCQAKELDKNAASCLAIILHAECAGK